MSLRDAIGNNDLLAAIEALDAGADPDGAMEVALANAFDYGVEAIALLVERGASPAAHEHDFGTTPLMHLAGAGELALVQALLDRGADVTAMDADRRTALDWALAGGCWRVAQRLVEAGGAARGPDDPEGGAGPFRAPPPDRDALARRCIAGTAAQGRLGELREILDAAPALARDRSLMAEAWTRASAAAIASELDVLLEPDLDWLAVLAVLEQRAAAPPWEDADRRAVLAARPIAGSLALLRHIVGRLGPLRDGERAAWIAGAAATAREDVLGWLLADTAASPVELGDGLLAAMRCEAWPGLDEGRLATARLLLDAGAPVDARGPAGETPLMVAASRQDVPMLELLLARGADVSAHDAAGRTAMAWANYLPGLSWSRRQEALDLLRRHGAADQRWTADPPVQGPPPPARLSAREELQLGLFVLVLLTLALAIYALRCVDAA
ncbi:MAG TPA: ankyrin repeat domain-containing protein [Kofleriaceae bacterium]|nr:ankyrin repeat domain-containing protein [Kofleriaceae bacterium]